MTLAVKARPISALLTFKVRGIGAPWLNKKDLALTFSTSVRTVETWMEDRAIPYRKLPGGTIRFDLAAVERFLAPGDVESQFGAGEGSEEVEVPQEASWGDKKAIATRYAVSKRTVENWMQAEIIPFRRMPGGRIRFDFGKVERALRVFDVPGVRR